MNGHHVVDFEIIRLRNFLLISYRLGHCDIIYSQLRLIGTPVNWETRLIETNA